MTFDGGNQKGEERVYMIEIDYQLKAHILFALFYRTNKPKTVESKVMKNSFFSPGGIISHTPQINTQSHNNTGKLFVTSK